MTYPALVDYLSKLSIRPPAESVNETEQNSKSRRITWDCEVVITSKRCRCLHKVLVRIGSNPVWLKLVKLQYRFSRPELSNVRPLALYQNGSSP